MESNNSRFIDVYLIFLSLVTFITPVYAEVGDLILDTEILIYDPDFYITEYATKCSTLLKEGYSLSLDKVWWNENRLGEQIGVANFTIFENGEVVKRLSANYNTFAINQY